MLSIYKTAVITLTILLTSSGCASPGIKLPKAPDYASMPMRGNEIELHANKPPLAHQANDVKAHRTLHEALPNKREIVATTKDLKSEYYDYLFSKTIEDPKFKSDIMACASAFQRRDVADFKKGFAAEIIAATSKQEAKGMKAVLLSVDDPLLYKTWCMKELITLMFDTTENALGYRFMPSVNYIHDGPDSYRLEWTYPIGELKAYREDLTDSAVEGIRKSFRRTITARNTKEEVPYYIAKPRIAKILEQCLDDFDYVNLKGRANDFRSWLARGLERTIYLRFANSKKYSASVVKPVRRSTSREKQSGRVDDLHQLQ